MKILIAEDEVRIRMLLKMYLERESHLIEEAACGNEAIEKALMNDFDLIILDILMPGKNGFEVLKELRNKKDTPVLFLTAKGDETDIKQGIELGASDYILKPFSPKEVVKRIHDMFS